MYIYNDILIFIVYHVDRRLLEKYDVPFEFFLDIFRRTCFLKIRN